MFYRKNRLAIGVFAATCSHLFITPALAQTPQINPEQIVVVANRIPVSIKRIATSVSVIDAEAITARGNASLKDILRQTTAVGGSNYGGTGSLSAIRIRGEESFRTLMLFDGIKLSDTSAPQVATPVEHLLSGGIGRVEILRGPQGLSYGADAGGVISISSQATEPGLQINLDGNAGSFGTQQFTGTASASNDTLEFYLSVSDYSSDGFNARLSDTVLADKDGYENKSYHARLGFQATDNLRLEVTQHAVDGDTQYDGCFAGTTVYDCEALYDFDATRVAANFDNGNFSHSLAYTVTDTDREDLALGQPAFGSYGELQRWEYVGSATQLPGVDLIYGIDLEQEQNGALNRDNEGYYVEVLSDFSDNLFLTAGARQDHNDDFGKHDSFRLSAAYLLTLDNGELKFKTSYGTGFRAPSLFEVDYNAGSFALPPASLTILREETSRGLEYGVEFRANSGLHLELTRFDQEVEDAIYFDLSAFSGYLQDLGTSDSSGYEVILDYPINGQLQLVANYTYNDTERPDGQQRLRRPRHLANAGISYSSHNDQWRVNGFYRWSHDAIDDVFGTVTTLEDTGVLDLTASYRLTAQIELYGRLENLLDDEFQEVIDYRSPERASYVGIRVNF